MRKNIIDEWNAKNINSILYEITDNNDHSVLVDLINEWAVDYSQGQYNLKRCVGDYLGKKKNGSLQKEDIDDFLWAMSESTGKISEYFSNIEPTPQWECIKELTSNYFTEEHFNRLGIENYKKEQSAFSHQEELKFSLLFRPIATGENVWYNKRTSKYNDKILENLIKWMILNINNENMFKWVVDHNFTSNNFIDLLKYSVYEIHRCSFTKAKEKLKKSPHSILSERMRILWILFLNDKIAIQNRHGYYYQEEKLLKNSKDINTTKILLKTLITPKLKVENNLSDYKKQIPAKIFSPIMKTNRYKEDLIKKLLAEKELHLLLDVFTNALDEIIVLLILSDNLWKLDSNIKSIGTHEQNKYSSSWYIIIEGILLCWKDLKEKNIDTARSHAEKWWSSESTIYKRLALYTAQDDNVIDTSTAIDWLESYQQNLWKKEYNDLIKILKDRESISEANNSRISKLKKENPFPIWGSDVSVSKYENAVEYPDTGQEILTLLKSNNVEAEQFSYKKYRDDYQMGWKQYINQNSEDKILAVLKEIKDSKYFIPLYSTLIYQIKGENNKFTKSNDKLLALVKIIPSPQEFKNSNFIHECWCFFDWLTTKHIDDCPDMIKYGESHVEALSNNTNETSSTDDDLLNKSLNSTIGRIVLTLDQYSCNAKNKEELSPGIKWIISNILESDDKSDAWAMVGLIFRNLYITDRKWAETLIEQSDDEKKINHIMCGIMATGKAFGDFSDFIFPVFEKYMENNTDMKADKLGSWIYSVSYLYVNNISKKITEDKVLNIYARLDEGTVYEILQYIRTNAENTNNDERINFIEKTAIPILELMMKDNTFTDNSTLITDLCLLDNTENHELYNYLAPHLNNISIESIRYYIENEDKNFTIVLKLLERIPNEELIENYDFPIILETLKNNDAGIVDDPIYKELKKLTS